MWRPPKGRPPMGPHRIERRRNRRPEDRLLHGMTLTPGRSGPAWPARTTGGNLVIGPGTNTVLVHSTSLTTNHENPPPFPP